MFMIQTIKTKFDIFLVTVIYVVYLVACSAPDPKMADQAIEPRKPPISIQLDEMFDTLAEQGFQGGAIVAKEGEVLWSGSYGKADIATGRPLDSNAIYELASVGKAYTAMAVLTLIEKTMTLKITFIGLIISQKEWFSREEIMVLDG